MILPILDASRGNEHCLWRPHRLSEEPFTRILEIWRTNFLMAPSLVRPGDRNLATSASAIPIRVSLVSKGLY
jgi:hypothetical protein